MRLMKAIALALAVMVITVMVWSAEVGRFVVKCLPGYRPSDPRDLVDQYIDVAKAEAAAHKPKELPTSTQKVADLLFRQQPIPDEILVGLGDKTLMWLEALNSDMLQLAAKSKADDLQAHLGGGKAIKGLLAYDRDSIIAYQEALKRDTAALNRAEKRKEQPFSPFGALC